jgi:hypothetical protein
MGPGIQQPLAGFDTGLTLEDDGPNARESFRSLYRSGGRLAAVGE